MRILLLMFPFLWAISSCKNLPYKGPEDLKVMTYNIRFNNPDDGLNAWPYRKAAVRRLVLFEKPDIFGIQEGLWDQVQFLDSLTQYEREGVGRDDGMTSGEFSALFFRKDRFHRLDGGTFWLSETPNVPSKGWDAALNRICTWAKLQDRRNGKKIVVLNTHFDHQGMEARIQSAELLHHKAKELTHDGPVILLGDFNLPPESVPIKKIQSFFQDAFLATQTEPFGPVGTFNAFKIAQTYNHRIDYVFVNNGFVVLDYQVRSDVRSGGYFLSDHFPVISRLVYQE